jgi:metal-responsive CopG/Arc/MetJ family transcriptional regulator
MERVQILLDSEQKRMLNKIAKQENQNFSELVRNMLEEQIEQHQKAQLAKAARALLADYEKDEELTAFTVLDGEDFHA